MSSNSSDDVEMSDVSPVKSKAKPKAKPVAARGKKTVEEEYKKMDPRYVHITHGDNGTENTSCIALICTWEVFLGHLVLVHSFRTHGSRQ
jgi:hypothetical protein